MKARAIATRGPTGEARLDARTARRLRDVEAELQTLVLDQGSALASVLPALRGLLEVDNLVLFTPVERVTGGFEIARFEAAGDIGFVRERLASFFDKAPSRYAWYDPTRPEPDQRNRVIDAMDLMSPDEYAQSAIYQQAMKPAGVHRCRQPRVLLCDGPSLLAWFGVFHAGEVQARLVSLLGRIAPMVQRRLRVERTLERAPVSFAALEASLAYIGAPAFVIGDGGAIVEANAAGRTLLDRCPATRAALADALRRRPTAMQVELTRLTEIGTPALWLAILPSQTADESVAAAIERAVERWELTRRQREVLELVVGGMANVTIAAELGVSVRAIELHVTSLLDCAGVDSRAALVAQVLLG